MPIIREPRTAEAKAHQARIAAVLQNVSQKFGLPGSEVYSPDFLNQHRPGDRWFCTICFGPMICAQEGHPLASNNGVERDGETQRLTVHCAQKDCKKRQCKAIRLSFNASVPTSEVVLKRIMALMQETSAYMEKSLGILHQGRKSSKGRKGSKEVTMAKGKGGESGKQSVVQGKGKVSRAQRSESGKAVWSDVKKGRGHPAMGKLVDKVALNVKEPPPAAKEVAEMLLDLSDRIPYGGVGCSSIKMWNSFDRKTKTCKNVVELIEQAKWLVGQFKPIIFNLKWLAGTQAEWLQECLQAQDFKHCKSLIQRLEGEALNWEAIGLMWKEEDERDGVGAEHSQGTQSSAPYCFRRSACLGKHRKSEERWSTPDPIHLSGWRRPKKITFVLGDADSGREEQSLQDSALEDESNWVDDDFSQDEEDDSASLDESPALWDKLDEDDGVPGVKHDRGFMDAGKFDSPAVVDVRKSPMCSPFSQPPAMDKVILGMGAGAMDDIQGASDFNDKDAGFDGHDVSSMSAMSTDDDYGDDKGWCASDFRADLGLGFTDLTRNSLTEIGPLPPTNLSFPSTSLAFP